MARATGTARAILLPRPDPTSPAHFACWPRGPMLASEQPSGVRSGRSSGEQTGVSEDLAHRAGPRGLGGRNGCPSKLLIRLSRAGAQAPGRVPPRPAHARLRARHKDPSMSNILVINASGQETRVALIEQGTISEYYLERKNEKGIVGNIYKGRVVRVLPGMQAAFVDIGLEKAAFLYVADIVSDPSFPGFSEEIEMQASAVEGDPLELEDVAEPLEEPAAQGETAAASGADAAATAAPSADIQDQPAPSSV